MSDWQDHYLGAVPAAPGTKGPDGRIVVAWVIDNTDTAVAVYSPFTSAKAPAPVPAAASAPGDLHIERTDKQYAKQSFWRFRDGDTDFIFIAEPGTDTPNDERVQKITRDAFHELKRTMLVRTYADIFDPETSDGKAAEPGTSGEDDDLI